MFNLGRGISTLSTLNWRDVFDNLMRFASGINSIDRHSLKKDSVSRDMIENGALYSSYGVQEDDIGFTVQDGNRVAVTWHKPTLDLYSTLRDHDELQRYKVWRRVVDLEDDEIGTYLIAWRIQFEFMVASDDFTTGELEYYAEISVDGVRLAGPFGGDDFLAPGFYNFGGVKTEGTKEFALSGASFATILPGKHVVDIDFISFEDAKLINSDVTIARMNW